MKIAIGCDHGGFDLKTTVLETIRELGHEVTDLGTCSTESVDYVDFAVAVAEEVAAGNADLGILTCGTGIGMSIAANKVRGAFCAHCQDCYSAQMAREHNGANILAIGGRVVGDELARRIITAFLTAAPSPEERHVRRRAKLAALES